MFKVEHIENINDSFFNRFLFRNYRKYLLIFLDLLGILGAFSLGQYFRGFSGHFDLFYSIQFLGILFFIIVSSYIFDLYQFEYKVESKKIFLSLLFVLIFSFIGISVWSYILGVERYEGVFFGRGILPLSLLFFGIYSFSYRIIFSIWFSDKMSKLNWLLVGKPEEYETLIKDKDYMSFNFMPLEQVSDQGNWSGIVVRDISSLPEGSVKSLLRWRLRGVKIYTISDFYELIWRKIPFSEIKESWIALDDGFFKMQNKINQRIKRVMDITSASLILVLSSPLCLLASLLIKITDGGPIFYKQVRKGSWGKPYVMFKFRSMGVDAERGGAVWASTKDGRITWIGNIIRKTRIDEIPQVLNVLRGEMSFIGPRPERPEFTEMLEREIPFYDLRHLVKPGITGWAQVNYPYGSSVKDAKEKLMYDLYYIKNFSIFLDLSIILKTIRVLILGKGR